MKDIDKLSSENMRNSEISCKNTNGPRRACKILTCQKNRGCGLGLTIAIQIVKGLSKKLPPLELESVLGVGTQFTFYVENRNKRSKGLKYKLLSLNSQASIKFSSIYSDTNS